MSYEYEDENDNRNRYENCRREEVYNQLMAEVASVMDNLIGGISSSASYLRPANISVFIWGLLIL